MMAQQLRVNDVKELMRAKVVALAERLFADPRFTLDTFPTSTDGMVVGYKVGDSLGRVL